VNPVYLVEECQKISIGAIRKDLRFKYADDEASLVFDAGDGHLPQQIMLTEQAITFGIRRYFVCACGARCNKLYLPPGKREYRCRACYRLRYELSYINRTSKHGRLLYRTNRMLKLVDKRAGMSRVFYNGQYTKRFDRFLNLCGRAGLVDVVNDAGNLKAAVTSL